MVSLPCRRAKKAENATTIPKENVPEPQSTQTPGAQATPIVDRIYTGEERQALESLFQQMDLPPVQTDLDMPSTQQTTAMKAQLEERRSRLELLSKRIRNRFSKDSGLRKSKSNPPVVQRSTEHAHNQFSPAISPGVLSDILGSGPASEGGYDSDAQFIVTPRAEPSIAGSAKLSPETFIPDSNKEPNDLRDETGAQAQGVRPTMRVQTSVNIENTSRLQTSDTGSKGPIHDAKLPEHLSSEILSSPSTAQTRKSQSLFPGVTSQLSLKEGGSLCSDRSKPGMRRTQESRASDPGKSSESMVCVLPQRCVSVTASSQPRVPSAKCAIGSPGNVLSPLDNLSRILEASNSHEKSLESIDSRIGRRATSSMYASHSESLPPSPNSSIRSTAFALVGELYSVASPTPLNAVEPTTALNIVNGVESNTISAQKSEPRRASSKSQDNPLPLSDEMGYPTQSKFTEELGSLVFNQDKKPDSLKGNDQRSSRSSRSTSDGWLSGGKRQGYGYDFVSEADGDTDIMWKKAIKAHVEEESGRARRRSGNSLTWEGKRRSAKSSCDCSSQSVAKPSSTIGAASGQLPSSSYQGKVKAPKIGLVKSKKERSGENNPVRALHTWTRFPSHTRAERCASASAADNVIVRDFSSSQRQQTTFDSSLGTPQVDGQVEVGTPRKTGREWLRPWTKFSKPSSVDLRRYRAGHWAGVSRSGHLKYPELELIPAGPRPYVVMEELGNVEKASKKLLLRKKDQTKAKAGPQAKGVDSQHMDRLGTDAESKPRTRSISDLGGETGMENEFVLASLPYLAPEYGPDSEPTVSIAEMPTIEPFTENVSAQAWSTLYEDCVNRPASDNGLDTMSLTSISSSRVAVPEKSEDQRLAAISTSIDLHRSTVEFKELQLADEVKTRDSLMRMVEAAWGSDESNRVARNASQSSQKGL